MSSEPRLPADGRSWLAFLLGAVAGAVLGWLVELWAHRILHRGAP